MSRARLDRGTMIGAVTAAVCVIAGFWLEGGVVSQIIQPTAALIVIGGTAGAVLIQFPLETVRTAMAKMYRVLIHRDGPRSEDMLDMERLCTQARKRGVLSLDAQLPLIEDTFLQKSLTLAVDGFPAAELRRIMETELTFQDERDESIVRVLEAAAGFAPTMGIIGAVLGLVQVMQRITDLSVIGKGIAVAFVSTLYGIGVANLVFLPLAGKLKIRLREQQLLHEMMLEGVLSIIEGVTAREFRERLHAYSSNRKAGSTPSKAGKIELAAR